jgi:hypothetical protein
MRRVSDQRINTYSLHRYHGEQDISIRCPKDDGTCIVEFRTAAGESLGISMINVTPLKLARDDPGGIFAKLDSLLPASR